VLGVILADVSDLTSLRKWMVPISGYISSTSMNVSVAFTITFLYPVLAYS